MTNEIRASPRKARQHNISLQTAESEALKFLAETGSRHGNKSAVVGKLLSDYMLSVYGEHWQQRVIDHFTEKKGQAANDTGRPAPGSDRSPDGAAHASGGTIRRNTDAD